MKKEDKYDILLKRIEVLEAELSKNKDNTEKIIQNLQMIATGLKGTYGLIQQFIQANSKF